ncbi:MAG: hypothetical protein ABSD59_10185 [Terracidiphilus sp.]
MKVLIALLMVFGAVAGAKAQVAPEGITPRKLSISGTLTYSARYSQMANFYNGSNGQQASISGDFGYSTTSERAPFAITIGAGDSWTISGATYNSGPYETLSVSQGIVGEHGSLQLSDSLGYHQGSPVTGFTGETGSGQPISQPNPPTDASILTLNTTMINNDATAEYSYKFSGFTTVSAGGAWNVLRYLNGNGLDTDSLSANLAWTRRLDARDSLVARYAFSQYSYPDASIAIDINTPTAGWQRTWTRTVSSSVSVGPQWVNSSGSGLASSATINPALIQVPSSSGVSASASVSDKTRFGQASLAYDHGVMGGGGYTYGGEMDDVTGSFSRQFGRQIGSQTTMELTGGYRRTDSLDSLEGNYITKYGSAQITRSLGRQFSVFAGYTGSVQSSSTQVSANVLNGLWQVVSFGIGFTPPQIHLRH